MIAIAGTPRSLAEIEFVAGMAACEACGDARPLDWRIGGHGETWIATATCPRCASERAFAFETAADLAEVEVPYLELGGPTPSAVLEPYDLVREIDRLVPTIALAPDRIADADWRANLAAIDRVRTALGELAKFAGPGGDIPVETLRTPASHLDRAMRPERYQRAWLREELAYWAGIAGRFNEDARRIFTADRSLRKFPRGAFDAHTLAAHRLWRTTGGAQGARLDVVTADVAARIARDTDLSGARLEHVSLAAADLVGADLAASELFDVDLQRARIETATFTGARLVRCELAGAIAETTSFAEVRAETCDFARALLATSLWTRARVEACTFFDCDLADSQLELARFTGCDFRGARFAGAVLAGAVFERCDLRDVDLRGCDLRGTAFVECAFAAAHGEPLAIEGWVVAAADFSDRADASDLGDADDLLAELVAR
jgi:uncharacterized protein YjbI with pentapeptide repeats